MTSSIRRLNCMLLVCFATTAVLLASPAPAAAADWEWTMTPEHTSLMSGEPCVLNVTIANTTGAALELNLGSDATEAFRFDMTNDRGERICHAEHTFVSGLSRGGRFVIPGGQRHEQRLALNRWCSTSIPPGSYTLRGFLRIGDEDIVAQTSLTIVETDSDQLRETFAELSAAALSTRPVAERDFAMRVLAGADHPLAIPALKQVIDSKNRYDFSIKAIDTLGRIDDPASVATLIDVAQDETLHPAHRRRAHAMISRLHDKTRKTEVRAACEAFIDPIDDRPTAEPSRQRD